MSGIGEASAVIGVVQVGFSLARTLNTYIGDYKDSRDSIISLASELDATIIQVKELNSLVRNSKTASEGSKKLAEKCIKDSDRLVKRLVELLTKARLPEDPEAIISISPGDIIPSRLTKAYWPFVKPQVDVVKSELQVMKTDILIARSCIQSQSATTAADRTAGEESIVALARSRVIARKLLREAMAEEKRSIAAMQDSVSAPNTALVQIPAPNGIDNNTQGGSAVTSPPSKPPVLNTTEPHADDASGTAADDARITKLAQDIQASVQAELARKDEERKVNETAEEAVKKSAVEAYQKSIGDRLERLLQNTEATQRLLKEVFGADLDQEKVKKFLVEQQSQQLKEEFGDMLSQFGVRPPVLHGGMVVDSGTSPPGPVVPLSRRRYLGSHIRL
jgi:hypothetical protein